MPSEAARFQLIKAARLLDGTGRAPIESAALLMEDGHIVVDSIAPIKIADITYDLARESGFDSVADLLQVARHGKGRKAYLIRFHYLAPGAWDTPTKQGLKS